MDFTLIDDGLGLRQIGDQMNIGISTVETYRNRIREKLGLKNSSELLQAAISWNRTGEFNGHAGQSGSLAGRETRAMPALAAAG